MSTAAAAQQWSTSADENAPKCMRLHKADAVKLWVFEADNQSYAKGSSVSHSIMFSVDVEADRPTSRCMWVKWKTVPWGPHPVDAAVFVGGKFPSGRMDIFVNNDHDEFVGTIQITVPDNRIPKGSHSFRVVLLDPISGEPLGGSIGIYGEGRRDLHPRPGSLDMSNCLVMTMVGAPEPAAKH